MKYLTIDDVCKLLSISRRTLERMRSKSITKGNRVPTKQPNDMQNITDRLEQITENRNDRVSFPEPDIYLGKSPRWDQDNLIAWLQENGHKLNTTCQ